MKHHALQPEAAGQSPQTVGRMLNLLLADEFIIYVATRECHWNFTGMEFDSPPELFEEQYRQLEEWTELLAERARQMNTWAEGGWSELIKTARLSPRSGTNLSAGEMIDGVIELHEAMLGQLRRDAGTCLQVWRDTGTADFLTVLLLKHGKAARQLRVVRENLQGVAAR
ncbi:MAG: ferritin-like domain-containing protein [Lacunisphaera sp.]|nr:ferritin-like domain-containing protein [Lacunisphaera sp.]